MPAHIGIREWERHVRQVVVVDLDLAVDARAAALRDDLGAAVDYGAVSRLVTALVQTSEADLVETLTERIAARVLAEFPGVDSLRVSLHKPGAVHEARDVVLTIERSRT